MPEIHLSRDLVVDASLPAGSENREVYSSQSKEFLSDDEKDLSSFVDPVITVDKDTQINLERKIFAITTLTITLFDATKHSSGDEHKIINSGSGLVTIRPYGTQKINGQPSYELLTGQTVAIITDQQNWFII